MIQFWFLRVKRSYFYYALFIGLILSFTHLIINVIPLMKFNNIIFTPYTSWMSASFTSVIPILFFLILPLISSLPVSTLFKDDKESGLLNIILIKTTKKKYFSGLFVVTFLIGSIVIAISLLVNALGSFLFLPNLLPDEIVNRNIGMNSGATILVDLYYNHPFIHMMLNILICSIFGGIFAVFSLSISFWIKNKFIVLVGGFIVQIGLLVINMLIFSEKAITPFFFLPENANVLPINIWIVFGVGIILFLVSCVIYFVGVKSYDIN
ncbi:hypothetical protein V7024_17075 [Bacillus sp. JJ864]|uniref:hypothetical protein n=1 Tax=Bacillus sp. JJ864 TaxID=3122975 RepID=UPI002FFDBD27